jgi:hypothetical protein
VITAGRLQALDVVLANRSICAPGCDDACWTVPRLPADHRFSMSPSSYPARARSASRRCLGIRRYGQAFSATELLARCGPSAPGPLDRVRQRFFTTAGLICLRRVWRGEAVSLSADPALPGCLTSARSGFRKNCLPACGDECKTKKEILGQHRTIKLEEDAHSQAHRHPLRTGLSHASPRNLTIGAAAVSHRKILIVDADVASRNFVARTLEQEGQEVPQGGVDLRLAATAPN